jgi:hypothetical protein
LAVCGVELVRFGGELGLGLFLGKSLMMSWVAVASVVAENFHL